MAGERNGDLVVKAPVAIPVSLNPSGGFGSGFPDSKMGVLAYIHQVWLDVDWSTKAEAAYEKNPRGMARPRYDRVNDALADALEDHALVLIPANSSLELRRALVVGRVHDQGARRLPQRQLVHEGLDAALPRREVVGDDERGAQAGRHES